MKFPTDVEPLGVFSTAFRSWSAACWIGAQWDLKTSVWPGVGVSTCFFFLPKIKKGSAFQLNSSENIYHLVIWRGHGKSPFFIGKPSISMGHLYHGKLLNNNQRVQVMNLQIHILEFKSVVFQWTTKNEGMDNHGKPIVWVCPKMGDIQTIAIVEANQNEQDYTVYFFVWTTNDAFSKSILGYHIHRIIISWSHMNIN